jgi:predicted CopG family antitoxin
MKMTSRNIAIRDDVYKRLLKAKKEEESFSDVIERLLEGRSEIMSYAGVFSGDSDFERALDDISTVRKRTVIRN